MKIAHVTVSFFPDVGGLATFVRELARHQQKRDGVTVKVLHCDRRNRTWLPQRYSHAGIEAVSLPSVSVRRVYLPLGLSRELEECDIVHLHDPFFLGATIGSMLSAGHRPVCLSTHGGFFHTPGYAPFKRLYAKTGVRLMLKRAAAAFACSKSDYETFSTLTRDVILIENGVELSKFGDQPGRGEANRLIYYGRLAQNKNVGALIDAFQLLAKKRPAARLDLVGEDVTGVWQSKDERERATLASLGLTYHGPVRDEQLAPLVHRSRFFVSASLYEGFGLSVVEAMAAGKIPIVNKIPAMSAFIEHGVNGYLIDFSDPRDASEEIATVMSLAEARHEELSSNAVRTAGKYGWDAKAGIFLDHYEQALHRRSDGSHVAVR